LSLLPSALAQGTNIALNKPSSMSCRQSPSAWGPELGNDGNTNGFFDAGSVFHTCIQTNNWWQVELSGASETCGIDSVIVWNRDSSMERINGGVVELWDQSPETPGSNKLATSAPLVTALSQTVTFGGMAGVRYVRVVQPTNVWMHLAEIQVFGSCGPSSAGAGGDPHFKLFNGVSYDFHGHCDLLLLESPSAADGAGLSVQVRSSPLREVFSYISEAAVKIGDDVLTIGSGGQHTVNGVPQVVGKTASLVADASHVYPVLSSSSKKGRHVYKIHLGDGPHGKEEIDIREYKSWITVTFLHPSASNLGMSTGLLGRFPDGAMLGRDGETIHTSYDAFGQDWQVPPGESLLGPGPFSDSCVPVQAQKRHLRRLEEASITREQAMAVCEHWGDQMEDCINDVQISGDMEMANEGPV